MQPAKIHENPVLIRALAWYAIIGCIAFIASILIADAYVPNHDWVADTMSDLAAGEKEYIVDSGLYAFSGSLIAIALLCAHVHLGETRWSFGVVGFALFGLIVFLVGARDEYGDGDNEGVVIHRYLVYAIGALMAALPWAMSDGAAVVNKAYKQILIGISVLWTITAPVFFVLPDSIDGIYERGLGLIAIAAICTMASLFILRARDLR